VQITISVRFSKRTGRFLANFFDRINTTLWTWGNFALAIEFDVRRQVVWKIDQSSDIFAVFKGELICGGIDLTKIIDTG